MQRGLVMAFASLSLTPLVAAEKPTYLSKRDTAVTWGPNLGLGPPSTGEIISVVSTVYPGDMPSNQAGGLFNWIGVGGQGDGQDLIQSIVGSYQSGQNECAGDRADELWCISSEVYGTDPDTSTTKQWVGELTSLDTTPSDGVTFNYTLVDSDTGLWLQTARNARTNDLLSTFNKTSGTMALFSAAVECQSCTPPKDPQYWINTTILLSKADPAFGGTLYQENEATYAGLSTPDEGTTWKIANITMPVVTPV